MLVLQSTVKHLAYIPQTRMQYAMLEPKVLDDTSLAHTTMLPNQTFKQAYCNLNVNKKSKDQIKITFKIT